VALANEGKWTGKLSVEYVYAAWHAPCAIEHMLQLKTGSKIGSVRCFTYGRMRPPAATVQLKESPMWMTVSKRRFVITLAEFAESRLAELGRLGSHIDDKAVPGLF